MIATKKVLFLSIFLCFSLSHQVFALGEALSQMASDAGDFAKDVGKDVGIGTSAAKIDREADIAWDTLLKTSPAAVSLAKTAKAVLIYPKILKAGLGIGGQHGEGALREHGKTVGYYNTIAGSYGLQIGAQSFGYVMFFMDDKGLQYLLNNNSGWEVGVGPSIVLVDEGMAKTLNNTTVNESVYVFTFSQKGLMAGAGIQGSKITKIHPDK